MNKMSHKVDQMKEVIDACAYGVSAACVMEWLTPIAAGFSILWFIVRIADYFISKRWKDKKGPD